jgi:L-lactate dehydrogenase
MRDGFAGIILVASNPVDLMARIARNRSRLPAARVIGTGTLHDTSRLQQALAAQLGVAPAAIGGLVIGEHGDSEVAALSALRIGGMTLDRFAPPGIDVDHHALAATVRDAAYAIITGKGYTSYGVATAIVRICEAIIRNERAVLPVSTLLEGQFGIQGAYLSLPCVIGREGIVRVLEPELDPGETAALRASAAVLAKAFSSMEEEAG